MDEKLIAEAIAARLNAHAPYSGFLVGAAVRAGGKVFRGCNVENASYGLTNCAERTAIFKAVSEGCTKIEAVAVVADTLEPIPPCGACRQVIAEFAAPETQVHLASLKGPRRMWTVQELLPGAFSAKTLSEPSSGR